MTQFTGNNNRSLIEECRQGDSKAQYILYNQYCKAMFNLAYRMLNNREDAEDMLQESFTDAFRKLRAYRFESTFGAWLKSIVINRCINHLRKKKVEFTYDKIPENNELYNQDDEIKDYKPEALKIARAIEKLPDGYRIVLTLYLLEGYTHGEISGILGIAESTSKTQYLRAKNYLRNILLSGEQE